MKEGTLQATAARENDPGDRIGLETIFLEHQGRVFRAAYRITGNAQDAEDVLQTVFLRLARREEGAVPVDNLASYLYRAAINAALDLIRARRDREVPLDEAQGTPVEGRGSLERTHQTALTGDWLRHALSRLNPRAAEVFTLRYFDDYDNKDIARMLGISRVSVAVTLHRTRHRLQKDFDATRRPNR